MAFLNTLSIWRRHAIRDAVNVQYAEVPASCVRNAYRSRKKKIPWEEGSSQNWPYEWKTNES